MRVREPKVINKALLTRWLTSEVTKNYLPLGAFLRGKLVMLLQISKYDNGALLCTIADSTHSMFAIISPEAISEYEVHARTRVTQFTKGTLIYIDAQLEWWAPGRFKTTFNSDYGAHSYSVFIISHLEVIDHDQVILNTLLETVYQQQEYTAVVQPIRTHDLDTI